MAEYVPAPHGAQSPPETLGDTDPALHTTHALTELELAGDVMPGPQGKHSALPPTATLGLAMPYVPAVHGRQTNGDDAPMAELAVPGEHAVHAVWPKLAYVPPGQAAHAAYRTDDGGVKPGGHAAHATEPGAT